jgi:hypothetical protein
MINFFKMEIEPTPETPGLLRSILLGVFLAFFSIAAVVASIEAGLRVFTGDRYLDTDLRLKHGYPIYAPNQSQRWKRLEWDVTYTINSKGFRDFEYTTPTPRDSMVVLGGSMAEGYGVDLSSDFVKLLEQDIRATGSPSRVYNGGLQSIGPNEDFEIFDKLFAPDKGISLVIMTGAGVEMIEREGPAPLAALDAPTKEYWVYSVKRFLSEHSVLYNLIRRPARLRWPKSFGSPANVLREYYQHTERARNLANWEYTADRINDFNLKLKKQGRRYLFVLLPVREQADDFNYRADTDRAGLDPRTIDRFAYNKFMADYCKRHGILLLDLTPGFRAANERRPGIYYFKTDGHWTPEGHVLAAGILFDYLGRAGLLKRP